MHRPGQTQTDTYTYRYTDADAVGLLEYGPTKHQHNTTYFNLAQHITVNLEYFFTMKTKHLYINITQNTNTKHRAA
jgi:hypothetical protein